MPQTHGDNSSRRTDEFIELARSAGAEVLACMEVPVRTPRARYFIGQGKAEEVAEVVVARDADLVLVDHELSAVQERNLEQLCRARVVDRTGLILDIFSQRARSHEGKLEVELAQLQHLATRLVRGWTHLERQRGGAIGLRGPGETQLETDRRLLRQRVKLLRGRLARVQRQQRQQRRARTRNPIPRVALVGYTNAGKSTLFNALVDDAVYTADQLFATLDPTVRKLPGLASGPALLADTVGFVRDLPHDLVAAFRATLAEARDADLLLHVVDASDSEIDVLQHVVRSVLDEIGAGDVPQLLVMNKIDCCDHGPGIDRGPDGEPRQVWLSASTGAGLDELRQALGERLGGDHVHATIDLAASQGKLYSRLHALGAISHADSDGTGWTVEVDAPRNLLASLAPELTGADARLLHQLLDDGPERDADWMDMPPGIGP